MAVVTDVTQRNPTQLRFIQHSTLLSLDTVLPQIRVQKNRGQRRQYSVFLFAGDERRLARCLENAAQLIDPEEDDLRAYALPKRGFKARLGKAALPEGIQWSALPPSW
jgi:CRISPR/Cas system-associated endoribonuclease Cas2